MKHIILFRHDNGELYEAEVLQKAKLTDMYQVKYRESGMPLWIRGERIIRRVYS